MCAARRADPKPLSAWTLLSDQFASAEFVDAAEAQKAAEATNFSTFKERLLRVDHADCRSRRSKVMLSAQSLENIDAWQNICSDRVWPWQLSPVLYVDQIARTFTDRSFLASACL